MLNLCIESLQFFYRSSTIPLSKCLDFLATLDIKRRERPARVLYSTVLGLVPSHRAQIRRGSRSRVEKNLSLLEEPKNLHLPLPSESLSHKISNRSKSKSTTHQTQQNASPRHIALRLRKERSSLLTPHRKP